MTDTNQKLREALQAFEKRGTGFDSCPTRRLPQSDEAKQIDQWWLRYFMDADLSVRSLARQALALPTADHIPDAGEKVADHFPDATKMIETAAPVGDLADLPRYTAWSHLKAHGVWPEGIDRSWMKDEMGRYNDVTVSNAVIAELRAALSAGDAVDAQRYRWLKGRSQVCLNQVWIGGYTTRQRDGDFLSKEDALSAIETAIDTAMRKGQL